MTCCLVCLAKSGSSRPTRPVSKICVWGAIEGHLRLTYDLHTQGQRERQARGGGRDRDTERGSLGHLHSLLHEEHLHCFFS